MATKPPRTKPQRIFFLQLVRKNIQHLLAAFSTFFQTSKELPAPSTPFSLSQRASILTAAMRQIRTTSFKAYDLHRRKLHTVEGSGGKPPPRKTSIHRISRSDWTVAKVAKPQRKSARKTAKKTPSKAASLIAASLLRCDNTCGSKCYTAFRKANDAEKLIDIKGPGKHGYGAYTKATTTLKKGQWLGEYVGQLLPLGEPTSSLYRFAIPGVCAIDADPCGNWTRFVNSSCAANLAAWTDTIGKRHVVFFQAMRDIGPEEELTFNYGKFYFEAAGFRCGCGCGAMKREHYPGEVKMVRKGKAKAKK